MSSPLKRYGFAVAIVAGLGLMTAVVAGKSLFGGGDRAAASAPQGQAKGPSGAGGDAPEVRAEALSKHTFSDAIQAIGTAQARESIVLTPKTADTIRRIRFESGDRVASGAVLVEMASVEQAADLAEARADREAAERELTRFQDLFDQGFAPRARLDSAQAAFDAADARLRAGQSRIADRTIRAPFSGVMGLRTASPGQYARPGDPIGTLDDISSIKLDFDVSETQIAQLRAGVDIVARTAAFPDVSFSGQIENVDSRIDPQTRTVRVRAILPNREERLRPGMLMTVEVRANPREALAVPENSVLDEADGAYVFTVASRQGEQVAMKTRVTTGARVGGMVEIVSGVPEGRPVVVEGVQRVRPNQPVRLAPAGETAPAAEAGPPVRGRS